MFTNSYGDKAIHFTIRGVKHNTNNLLWIMCISNNAIWAITTRKNFENFLEFQIFRSTTPPRGEKSQALFSMEKISTLNFSINSRQKPSVHREKCLCRSDLNLSTPYTSLGKPRWKYVGFFLWLQSKVWCYHTLSSSWTLSFNKVRGTAIKTLCSKLALSMVEN